MKNRIIYAVISVLYIILIFFLTFQGENETEALSDGVNSYVQNIGIIMPAHELRSWVHIPMYFELGIFLFLFFISMSWKLRWGIVLGLLVGLVDEFVKLFLPTREFDFFDLIRDFIGVAIAFFILFLLHISHNDKWSISNYLI